MKKIIRLTENDLVRLVKRVLKEDVSSLSLSPSTSTATEQYSAEVSGGWIKVNKTTSKPVIDPKTKKPVIDPKTNQPKISTKNTTKSGCVVFTKSVRDKNWQWKFDDQWAQGVEEESKQPFKFKFRFSNAIKILLPKSLESMGLSNAEIKDLFTTWSGNSPLTKIIYSKNNAPINTESGADTKLIITIGGTNANNICKKEWG